MFDPKTTNIPYTEYTDEHYLEVKKNNGLVFDKNYPFIDKSKSFKRKRWWFNVFYHVMLAPVTYAKIGLKIKGKNNLKKYKDVLNQGVVSVCNHIHLFDYLGIKAAISPNNPDVLIWAPNIRGEFGGPMRLLGGIPIPENDVAATVAYIDTVQNYINNGGWLHIYPEGSMWEFYAPIRPFKKGAAYFACLCNKPILPMAYSYRKPGWFRGKVCKQPAKLTLTIGEPIYPNNDLPKHEKEADLTKRSHDAVCRLAGIDPKDNIYPPIFAKNKRIDYYS